MASEEDCVRFPETLLTDDVAVVTGGASGNGRSIALKLAEAGADVVVADIRKDPREGGIPTHERIQDEGGQDATFVECDVSKVDNLQAAIDAADEFGSVSIMVNNAGIFRSEEFLETTEEEFQQMVSVNLKGVFFGSQLAARRMVEDDGGAIVNISSVAGIQGSPTSATYSATKGGVKLLTQSLALQLGVEGIRVNSIHPGLVDTEMTNEDVPIFDSDKGEQYMESIPLGRAATSTDVARTVVYLVSDLASYVNGEALVVDGGLSS